MKLVDASLDRPVTVLMVTAGIVIFGFVAVSRLAVELLPDISYPSLTVRTDLPDAAPEDVEQFVTRVVEERVGVVPGLVRLRSVSRPGQSEVVLDFSSGTRMDLASLAVREKLDLASLPREAKRPAILRFDPSLDPILRVRLSGGGNLQRLRRISDQTIKSDLEGTPGVAAVKVVGGEEEEIQVEVDVDRLSGVGLSLADVTSRLAQENVNVAGGSLTEGTSEYLIRATNQFLDPAEIRDVVLASRPDGVVRVSDVATVTRGAKDREVITRVGGEESVEIAIYKEGDANTVAVARAVKRHLKRLELPPEMKLVTVADPSLFIENAIQDVINAAWQGGLLAVLVLFAFLRDLRSTLTVALSIPVSVFATFIFMYKFGLSLNVMSLGGLALGIGMLVDNSIVVLESIFRSREEGMGIREAASRGAGSVAMAVNATTLTTVAVFLPLVFVEGLAGQLIRDQALTISLSIMASLVVSLTLVPMITVLGAGRRRGATLSVADLAPEPESAPPGRRGWLSSSFRWAIFVLLYLPRWLFRAARWTGRKLMPTINRLLSPIDFLYGTLVKVYPGILRRALANPGKVLAGSTLGFAAIVLLGFLLPRNLFPPFAQGAFHFTVRLPEGTALAVTDETLNRIASTVREDPRVQFVYTNAGQVDVAEFSGSAHEANRGRIAVVLKKATDGAAEEAVADRLRAAMADVPGLTYDFGRPALFTFRNPVEVEIYASNLDTLRAVSELVAARMEGIESLEDVESSVRGGDPEVRITFDRARLAAASLDPDRASRLVRNAVQGEAATQFADLDRKLDIRVRANAAQRSVVADLAHLEVGRNEGLGVPLGAVADVRVDRGPGEIRRISQQRASVISANLRGTDLGSAAAAISESIASLDLPPGVRVSVAGQNKELAQSFSSLQLALLLAIFLVYLVMASQFESLLHPFVIMFTLPLSLVGVVLTLFVTGSAVSVMSIIGFIILVGIVVDNAIILIDYANQLRERGRPKIEALVEAGQVRLRPIVMTTLTTVLGVLPMAIGIGEASEIQAPLAFTLIGGLTFGTLLTLVVIPVVYAVLDRTP